MMRNEPPRIDLAAYAIRTAGLRQRVRELWAYAQRMDYSDREHRDTFHRWHCAIWDACIGPELPAVQQILRTWPQRTEADITRINRRITELRDQFIRPLLEHLVGDMPEAHQLALFHQSLKDPKYYDIEIRSPAHVLAFVHQYVDGHC